MRHHVSNKRLGRITSHRKATLKHLVSSLLEHQEIETTFAKAKQAQRLADSLITLGKRNTLHAKRQAYSILCDRPLTLRLFSDIAPRFKNRSGGYTRVFRLRERKGDAATLALLELTEKEIKEPKVKKVKKDKEPVPSSTGIPAEAQTQAPSAPSEKRPVPESFPKHPHIKKERPKQPFWSRVKKIFSRNKGQA